jgi:spore germination cell wall hydrolase CwlJ-like protein
MKAQTSVIVVGGLALALWGGISNRDLFAQAKPGPRVLASPPASTPAPVTTDLERRAALNARLRGMLAEGKGGRLADAPTTPRTAPARPLRSATAATLPRAAVRASVVEAPATIPPPAYDPAKATPASAGRRYTPPRLDLTTPPVVPTDPIACLTQAIYYEARNESEDGQAAVAEVVLNRAGSGSYPRDVCQVVYQRNSRTCQFTFTCDGSIGRSPVNMTAWARAERIARKVYAGESKALLPRNSVNYHANYVRPSWSRRMAQVRRIGTHIFYGSPLNGGSAPGAESPSPLRSLLFVKNDAIERAYALLTGGSSATDERAPDRSSS